MADAIVRTLVRLYVTRRQLLEWMTAAQAKAGLRPRPPRLLPANGRRRRAGRRRGSRRGVWRGRAALARRAARSSLLWAAVAAGGRWISRAARAPRARSRCRCRGRATPPVDRAPHLAVLRDVRRAGGPRAAARQLPGRRRSRSSPTARRRRTSGCTCCRRSPRATSAGSARSTPSDRLEATLATMSEPRALPRPLLQLVRDADAASRSSRSTSRRSTAETWPATCSRSRGRAARCGDRPCGRTMRFGRSPADPRTPMPLDPRTQRARAPRRRAGAARSRPGQARLATGALEERRSTLVDDRAP